MNTISIAGRLGADPELIATKGGAGALCKFRVAIDERVKRGDTWEKATLWLTVITFGNRAEALNKILAKGKSVAVNGRLVVREFEAKDGSKGKAVEVIADNVTLLGSKGDGDSRGGERGGRETARNDDAKDPFDDSGVFDVGDLPF